MESSDGIPVGDSTITESPDSAGSHHPLRPHQSRRPHSKPEPARPPPLPGTPPSPAAAPGPATSSKNPAATTRPSSPGSVNRAIRRRPGPQQQRWATWCVSVGVRRVPWVLLGRRGHFAMVFTGVKCPRFPGAGRRAAPNARNAGISGRDRAGPAPLPDHAEEPTRNSLQRKRTHGPSMLPSRAGQPQRWPMDVVPAATMAHRCGYRPRPDSIHGPSLRFAARICPLRRCSRPAPGRPDRSEPLRAAPGRPGPPRAGAIYRFCGLSGTVPVSPGGT